MLRSWMAGLLALAIFPVIPVLAQPQDVVAVRQVSEAAGAQVEWNWQEQTVTIRLDGRYLCMAMGSDIAMEGILQGGSNDGATLQTDWYQMDGVLTVQDGTSYAPADVMASFLRTHAPQQAEGWIFYSSWTDGGALYRMDSNGRNRKKLSSRDCHDIFYADGWVYFSPWDERDALYRVSPDGESEQCILPENSLLRAKDGDTLYFLKRETSLFYPNAGKLYSLSLDTMQETLILDEIINYPRLHDGYFYYQVTIPEIKMDRRIYRVKADGTEKACLTSGDIYPYYGFDIYQNAIYFNDETYHVFRMDLNGKNLRKMSANRMFLNIHRNVLENTLLYNDMDHNWAIRAMDLDGGNDRLLADHGRQLFIDDVAFGWLYYSEMGEEEGASYCVRLDGTDRRKLSDVRMFISPYGEQLLLYPSDYKQRDRGIYICNPDGTNMRRLAALPLESMRMSDKWIYFTDQNSYFIHRVNLQGEQTTLAKEDVRFWTFVSNEPPIEG